MLVERLRCSRPTLALQSVDGREGFRTGIRVRAAGLLGVLNKALLSVNDLEP